MGWRGPTARRWLLGVLLASVVCACGREEKEEQPARRPTAVRDVRRPALPQELVPDEHGRVLVRVDARGFHPSTIHARRGSGLTLLVERIEASGCGTEIVLRDLGIERPLPLGERVSIPLVVDREELRFSCAMDMMRGRIVGHVDETDRPPTEPSAGSTSAPQRSVTTQRDAHSANGAQFERTNQESDMERNRRHRMVPTASIAVACALGSAACGRDASAPPSIAPPPPGTTEIRIEVHATGYRPAEATAPAGAPVRLLVTRTTDEGCGQELVIPSLGIRRQLPLGQAVPIDLTMPASGRVRLTCGMDMYEGAIVVR